MKKGLDEKYTRMLRTILNKAWKQHATKKQLCGHLTPIPQTNQVRQVRHTGKEELIYNVLLWTSTHGRVSINWPVKN